MKKYHASIKKDVEIHMTQQDRHGTAEWKSYKTACTIWSPLKKSVGVQRIWRPRLGQHFLDDGTVDHVFIFTSKILSAYYDLY